VSDVEAATFFFSFVKSVDGSPLAATISEQVGLLRCMEVENSRLVIEAHARFASQSGLELVQVKLAI